jgi:hypothetical protein
VVLPYGARLTPLAVDWARGKKVAVGYGPDELVKSANGARAVSGIGAADAHVPAGAFLWWCDGPCGAAKAAVGAQAKESSLAAVELPSDGKNLVPAIKRVAVAVKEGKAAGGVLLVQSGAAAVMLANRCPVLRAIVGTTLESLEAGIVRVAANVLVLEYPNKSFSQLKNLLSRFARARRDVSEDLKKQIEELASCG